MEKNAYSGGIESGMSPLILFGGGLDSCAMVTFYHAMNPTLLYFNYGQKAAAGERRALLHYSFRYKLVRVEIDLPSIVPSSPLTTEGVVTDSSQHAKNYIPGRNLLFSSIAYSIAAGRGLSPIMLGASPAPAESAFHDAKQSFASQFNMLTSFAYPDEKPWLLLPLVTGDRREYLRKALDYDPNLFRWAWTCYESPRADGKECGRCVHCQQKRKLADELGAHY